MKYRLIILILVCNRLIYSSDLQFVPDADTIYVDAGCTLPMIITSYGFNWLSSDSIVFSPSFDTRMSYKDTLGSKHDISSSAFLIPDSIMNYEYEIWYHPIDTSWLYETSFEVVLDTSLVYLDVFQFTLYMKDDSIVIDSLSQVFKATSHGLQVNLEPTSIQSILLYPNYPNPFNAQTLVKYNITRESEVRLVLYDITGRCRFSDYIGRQPIGIHTWQFTRSNFSSGVYFFQIQTQFETITQKWILLK